MKTKIKIISLASEDTFGMYEKKIQDFIDSLEFYQDIQSHEGHTVILYNVKDATDSKAN